MPALCPRIACHISASPIPEEQRMAGQGSLEQVHRDLRMLEELGAEYVVLDTKLSSPTALSPLQPRHRVAHAGDSSGEAAGCGAGHGPGLCK